MTKLNIGAGPTHLEGEIGIDLYKTEACQIIADAIALPFADDSAEFIRLDHILEHQPVRNCVQVLLEAHRVLCTGGTIKVGVPDLLKTCKDYVEQTSIGEKALLLRGFYGSQVHPGEFHKSGWDPQTLDSILKACGFYNVTVTDEERMEGYCISATGIK